VYTEGATAIPVGIVYLGFTSLAMHRAAQRAERAGVSQAAAVATAAHDVLAEYFPASTAALGADLVSSLAAVPDGRAQRRGETIGARAAHRLIESREGDGRDDTTIVYRRQPAPGVWQPVGGVPMLAPWLGEVRPLVVRRGVRVDGPDDLTSTRYAKEYEEVRTLGEKESAAREDAQTDVAEFFNINPAVMLGQGLMAHLESHPMSLADTAHLFALMHTSMADSIITCWRLKFEVGFWRPMQAVAGAAEDGNPATEPEADWEALLPVPPYGDYLSGHGSATGSAVQTIRHVLGESTSLTLKNPVSGVSVTYPDLTSLEHDAFMSRIWGGLHFRDAMQDAYRMAHTIADRAVHRLR
jgi:hypothetical protein